MVRVHGWQIQWRRHGECAKHREAVRQTAELEAQADVISGGSTPPTIAQFKNVLQETIANGGTDINGIKDSGARKKIRKLQFCLAEAKRRESRNFWRKCTSMTLAQDKRGARLVARWRACTTDLEVRTAVIGLARDLPNPFLGKIGSDSTRHAPYIATGTGHDDTIATKPDIDEFAHLCSIIEVFVADAEAAEQRVGKDLGFFRGRGQEY